MYVYYNANPARVSNGDCVLRALSKVMNLTWDEVAIDLCMMQISLHDMQNANIIISRPDLDVTY